MNVNVVAGRWAGVAATALAMAVGCSVARARPQVDEEPPRAIVNAPPLLAIRDAARELTLTAGRTANGFEPLVAAIGESRIVMIGEPWHGDGGAIRLRAELVRFLHERMGFNVLVFEDDFYSIDRGAPDAMASGGIIQFAQDNLYPMRSKSKAAAPLWAYIDAQARTSNPIRISGADPRHTGSFARTHESKELELWLSSVPEISSDERALFLSIADRFVAQEFGYKPTPEEQRIFFATLERLESLLSSQSNRDEFAIQEVRNLRGAAQFTWLNASRDKLMGDNFAWLATTRFPREKIILWAHNNHLITDHWMYFGAPDSGIRASVSRRSAASLGRWTYLGEEVRRYFGPTVYSIATLSYSGSYSPLISTSLIDPPVNFDSLQVLAPALRGTVEEALATAGHELAFVNLRPLRAMTEGVAARALDYSQAPAFTMRYWESYDAFLFVRTTFGLNQEPPATWAWSRTRQ